MVSEGVNDGFKQCILCESMYAITVPSKYFIDANI